MYTPTITRLGVSSVKLQPFVYEAEQIPVAWGELEPFIEASVRHSQGTISLETIRQLLLYGLAVAFSTVKDNRIQMVLVVMTVEYSTYRTARIIACAGRGLREATQFIDALEAWALTMGAVELEGWCRPAVARIVQRLGGWEHKFTIVSKNLRRKLQ